MESPNARALLVKSRVWDTAKGSCGVAERDSPDQALQTGGSHVSAMRLRRLVEVPPALIHVPLLKQSPSSPEMALRLDQRVSHVHEGLVQEWRTQSRPAGRHIHGPQVQNCLPPHHRILAHRQHTFEGL